MKAYIIIVASISVIIAICGIAQAYAEIEELLNGLPRDIETRMDIRVCDFQSKNGQANITLWKETCDYEMQQAEHKCNNFELSSDICAKGQPEYEMVQRYLTKYGLN
jgi:hypothetical protein